MAKLKIKETATLKWQIIWAEQTKNLIYRKA